MAPETLARAPQQWEQRAREFQERLGCVGPQPANETSYTNRRFTVNFTAPLEQVQRLLPPEIQADPMPGHPEFGMVEICACEFWVTPSGDLDAVRQRTCQREIGASCRSEMPSQRSLILRCSRSSMV